MPAETTPPPAPHLEVHLEGESRTLTMSFGLLNELTALVGGPEGVATLHFDPTVRTQALQVLLAKRDRRGRITNDDDDSIVPFDLDPAEAETMTTWIAEHCLDFFIRQFAKSAGLLARRGGELAGTVSSLTSSPSLPGKTPSA